MEKTSNSSFINSWFKALNFLGDAIVFFLVMATIGTLLNFPFIPSLFLSEQAFSNFSGSTYDLAVQFVAILISAWLTLFVWIVTLRWRKHWEDSEEKKLWTKKELMGSLEEAFWSTPGYILFSLGYGILMLFSLFALVLPVFYIGPRFFLFPYLSALDLIPEGEARLHFTHGLTRGEYFPCLFFFILLAIQEVYLAYLGKLQEVAPAAVVLAGLLAISVVAVFIEIWMCLFADELLTAKNPKQSSSDLADSESTLSQL